MPALVVEALAWVMVGWIAVTGLCYWAAATARGAGWLGLVLPQVLIIVSIALLTPWALHNTQL
jgi:hypothetical protein